MLKSPLLIRFSFFVFVNLVYKNLKIKIFKNSLLEFIFRGCVDSVESHYFMKIFKIFTI